MTVVSHDFPPPPIARTTGVTNRSVRITSEVCADGVVTSVPLPHLPPLFVAEAVPDELLNARFPLLQDLVRPRRHGSLFGCVSGSVLDVSKLGAVT